MRVNPGRTSDVLAIHRVLDPTLQQYSDRLVHLVADYLAGNNPCTLLCT